jgi:HAD superfamily hydrolase (TIGR01509 family)
MIKAVIFDIDGVLLDSFEANLKFFQNLMLKTGYDPPTRESFKSIFHFSLVDSIRALTKSNSELEIKRVLKIGKSRKTGYEVALLAMPEKVGEVIQTLSEKFLLGIVTSRIKESVYEAPELKKLKEYFRIAVSYEDTEYHKPHPEPLLFAAKELKVQPTECVYIGDVENDIKAARAAEMKIIIYSKDQYDQADACTSSFVDLPKLISSFS